MIRKPAIITAASIAGVVLAGGAAVGANIGILDAADNSPLGNLSAEAVVASPDPSPTTSDTANPTPESTQTFTVDAAGDIDIAVTGSGLTIADVRPNSGWAWNDTSTTGDRIRVRFSSDADVLEFSAELNSDGTIAAKVDRPSLPAAPTPATANTSDDDRYEDDDHDDDRYEDDDHDDDRYEDDDHDEYEGRDDDD